MLDNTTKVYKYPCKPGMEEWGLLKDKIEKLKICQIPENTIGEMSTKELFQTVLEYPLLEDIHFFDDIFVGLNYLKATFNGFAALLERPDYVKVLLHEYDQLKDSDTTLPTDSSCGKQFFKFANFEALLLHAHGKFPAEQRNIRAAFAQYQPKNIKLLYQGMLSRRLGDSKNVELAFSALPSRGTGITVTTPGGKEVEVIQRIDELTEYEKVGWVNYVTLTYPKAKIMSEATVHYNCHSYAWYMQSTSNPFWMNDPSAYMTDDKYNKIVIAKDVPDKGDKVFYRHVKSKNWHSGVVDSYDKTGHMWVVSKWGKGCLVEHLISDCPYEETEDISIEYWRLV